MPAKRRWGLMKHPADHASTAAVLIGSLKSISASPMILICSAVIIFADRIPLWIDCCFSSCTISSTAPPPASIAPSLETNTILPPGSTTLPVVVNYPIEWNVATATYIGGNGQIARHLIRNESGDIAKRGGVVDGVVVLPTLEDLLFTYDKTRYTLHGWSTTKPVEGVTPTLVGLGGTQLKIVNESLTFHAVLRRIEEHQRREPLVQLVQTVRVFRQEHIKAGTTRPWDDLWTAESWQLLKTRLDEASPFVDYYLPDATDQTITTTVQNPNYIYDVNLVEAELHAAYANLFDARLALAPISRQDVECDYVCECDDECDYVCRCGELERSLNTMADLLILLVTHSTAMFEEKEHFHVDRWTWTTFEVALAEAEELLLEMWIVADRPIAAFNLPELLIWARSTPSVDILETYFTHAEINKVFFELVEALQAVTVRFRPSIDLMIWLGAFVIIIALIGTAAVIDMFRGRGAVVKIEQPWTTYG